MYFFDTRSVLPVISEWIVRIVESKGKLMFLQTFDTVTGRFDTKLRFRYKSFPYKCTQSTCKLSSTYLT